MAATCLKNLVAALLNCKCSVYFQHLINYNCMFFLIVVVLFLVLLLGVGVGTLIYAWYTRQRGKLPYDAFMIILFTVYLSLV